MRNPIPIPEGVRWDLPSKVIAELNGVKLSQVHYWRRRAGKTLPRGVAKGSTKLHPRTVEKYRSIPLSVWAKGLKSVAKEVGVSKTAVTNLIRRNPELYGPEIDAWRDARLPIS